jgi:hypothetical protein
MIIRYAILLMVFAITSLLGAYGAIALECVPVPVVAQSGALIVVLQAICLVEGVGGFKVKAKWQRFVVAGLFAGVINVAVTILLVNSSSWLLAWSQSRVTRAIAFVATIGIGPVLGLSVAAYAARLIRDGKNERQ